MSSFITKTAANFGIMPPKTAGLYDALWTIMEDPRLLAMFTVTFLSALFIPFAVAVGMRKWREFQLRRAQRNLTQQQKTNQKAQQQDQPMELPNGAIGSFNRAILNRLPAKPKYSLDKEDLLTIDPSQTGNNDESSPFISRKCLTLKEEEENNENEQIEEEEDGGEVEKEKKMGDEIKMEKKEKKKRKKYKDPDPETAEALNKLIQQGLHGKLATAQLRAKTQLIKEQMSEEERARESQVRHDQLASIFKMMETQKEKFGIYEEQELEEQMKMYSV